MNRFDYNYKRTPMSFLLKYAPLVLFVGIVMLFTISVSNLKTSTLQNEEELLHDALSRSITQCYALTGTYPPSLEYIEKEYGLTYNKSLFFVDYQPIASNILPSVTIIKKVTTD